MTTTSPCFFLGANTPQGFYSLYDQLLLPQAKRRVYLLKGGPGCGKSSLMRHVAAAASARGLPLECIQCSGDPDSLDAVIFPSKGVAIVDATAPHIIEPSYPGVIESYVNLGQFYDTKALNAKKTSIISCTDGVHACYKRAYRLLDAALKVREPLPAAALSPSAAARMKKRIENIAAKKWKKKGTGGQLIQRFLGGVTFKGQLRLYETAELLCDQIYEFWDNYALSGPALSYLQTAALKAGYDVISCPDPLHPDVTAHLIIPELSLAFVTSSDLLPYRGKPARRLRFDMLIEPDWMRKNRARLRFAKKMSKLLLADAVAAFADAKAMHDQLEALYNPHVDFEGVYATAEQIAGEILAL